MRHTPVYSAEEWLETTLNRYPNIKEVVFQDSNDLHAVLSRFRHRGIRYAR